MVEPALACWGSTLRIEPRCKRIWKPDLVAGASMFATGAAPGTALDTGVGRLEAPADDTAAPGEAGALDSGVAGPELDATPEAGPDDGVAALGCDDVQPARKIAGSAATETTAADADRTDRRPDVMPRILRGDSMSDELIGPL